MNLKIVNIGDKLELLSVNKLSDLQERKIYKSQILDIYPDQKIQVAMPIEGCKILLLPIGGKFETYFYSNGGIYTCIVQIYDRYKKRNQYVLDLELLSSLKRYQRREYFRLEYNMKILYRFLTEDELELELEEEGLGADIPQKELPFLEAITLDISGGGMRFVTKNKMHRGEGLLIKMKIGYNDKQKEIVVPAKVLNSQNIFTQRDKVENRVEFIGLDDDSREEIIRFIFEKERNNRKKEKR